MGLTSAMGSALSGLRVTQSQMEVVSQNIANIDSVGYTRRQANVVERSAQNRSTGAMVTGIQRQFDGLVQKQLRTETAGAAYTDVRARYAGQLDQMFGKPGAAGGLDGQMNTFVGSLQALSTNPSNPTARSQVLSQAQSLAGMINGLSEDVQRLRSESEIRIADGVQRVNGILARIEAASGKLSSNGNVFAGNPALLDERDGAIQELSAFMDVRVVEAQAGQLNIYTTSGVQLFGSGRAASLSFDSRAPLNANSLYNSDPLARTVGSIRVNGIGGAGIDLTEGGLLRSGSLAAELDMRDRVLVQAQAQLDNLAAGLASSLGDRSPVSTTTNGVNAGFDIELDEPQTIGALAMKAGNSLTVEVNTPTGLRRVQVIATDGAAPNPLPTEFGEGGAQIVRFDRAGGFAGLQAAVAGALGAGFTVSLQPVAPLNVRTALRIVDAGGGNSVAAARAGFSTTSLVGQGAEMPLFVDAGTGQPYTGTQDTPFPQVRGFASRITINGSVLSDPSRLVVFDTTPVTGTQQGDVTRPRLLLDRLTSATRGFQAGTGIGGSANGFRSTVTDFSRRIVEFQGSQATEALNVDEGQKLVLRSVEARFSETSGVSIDQEMSNLVEIQNAYAANARVVSAVKELFDVLLRIGA
ncbi:MAG: flagellar hook-associated protein FlgK [Beijerinckiaceae bacterium]